MRNKGIFPVILIVLLFNMVFYNCKKTEENTSSHEAYQEEISMFDDGENPQIAYNIKLEDIKNLRLTFKTDAHKKYLADPLDFFDLPDGGVPEGNTAVVGSDFCKFYPVESISTEAELAKLPEGELIPFSSIIPLGERLSNRNKDDEWFPFEDNYNHFYKTIWNGKRGIVFGADLFGIDSSNEENRINSLLYKYNGSLENFFPVAGYDRITPAVLNDLETNGIAFQAVKHSEYRLSSESPDDMISLYKDLYYSYPRSSRVPIFVTTDLAAHANHLIFSRMLQYIEEEYFYPQLVRLTDEYIKAVEQRKNQISDNVYSICILYFQTAKALLALAPDKTEGSYYQSVTYKDVDAAAVLRPFPSQVKAEIEKMDAAQGFGISSVFSFMNEDYSQYKVRGHYTKNGVLGAYFRALIWYGRINFNLGGEGNVRDFALQLAPAALFITDITENSPNIKRIWQSLFDPITELIGVSDDISFHELIPLWNNVKGAGFNQWYSDSANLQRFITSEYSRLRPPSISGSSLIFGAYDGGDAMTDRKPPIGWRLFGQRYTLDSEIHYHVSPPRYFNEESPRHMVRGLDIMKVFGSATADWLLRQSDYSKHKGLEDILNSLQSNMENLNSDYWFSTYYTNNLYQIKTLSQFESGTGFYFTEKPGWNLKAMNSAHGTWAELRHDTILYVKQNYAEMGGGRAEPTFRTKPLPEPVHYLEPNIPFWNTCIAAYQKLHELFVKYNYMDETTDYLIKGMHSLYVKAAQISKLQADDKEVSESDLLWISRIANELSYRVMTHAGGNEVENTDSLRMALVADVYTNAEVGLVLETATGIPYRLYIPLNDGQGGKRIAVGYGFSYYEFHQPMSNRLNNEEWKAIVYGSNPDMSKYLPFWMQGRVLPPK
ncbi:MAG: DUF3160 domain-containing protein [Treponema sp.]|nr:DUF3160 domain-containing protein [Treponema sp.]